MYNKTSHKTAVPWRIHMVNPPDLLFCVFYHQEGAQFIEGGSHSAQLELHSTFVGSSKDRLDTVDSDFKSLRCYQRVWPLCQVPCSRISLEDYTFSCGAALSDLELPSVLSEVYARDQQCYDPVIIL